MLRPFSLILVLLPFPALAADIWKDEDDKGILSIVVENDSFTGSDRDYTSGVRMAWLSPEDQMPYWSRSLANLLPLASDGNKRISLAAGQNIYTPQNVTSFTPIPGDRPYAGWLYGSIGMVSDTGHTLDNVMLTVGVVGPWSYAEQSQKFVHHVIDGSRPKGWDNQLENEPGIILTYERKWRNLYQATPFGVGADVTPHVGMNLGNINTDASVGATFRLGYDLPADYGPPRIRPSLPGSDFFVPTKTLGGYLFTTLDGRAVGRNIFLDGNTFKNSPQVDKEILVGSLQIGAAITYGSARLSYSQVYMTKEYRTQREGSTFGVLSLSCRF